MIHSALYYFHKINMQENIKKANCKQCISSLCSSFQEHLEKAAMRIYIGNLYTFYYLYVTRDNIFGF